MTKTNKPNPGSAEAVEQGCACPVLDNGKGKGSGYKDENGLPLFYINEHCKIHAKPDIEDKT